MIEPSIVEGLVDSLFKKKGCFSNLDYPYAYTFFLDSAGLHDLIALCNTARDKGVITLPPSMSSTFEMEVVLNNFELLKHKKETAKRIQYLLSDKEDGDLAPLYKLRERHSYAIEKLYHEVFYGCFVHIRESNEPGVSRARKLSKRLVQRVLKSSGLADSYVIKTGGGADCELDVVGTGSISGVECYLGGWGRELTINVTTTSSTMVSLSEFFGVATNIYVHDNNEIERAIVGGLQLVKCINDALGVPSRMIHFSV